MMLPLERIWIWTIQSPKTSPSKQEYGKNSDSNNSIQLILSLGRCRCVLLRCVRHFFFI
ncbi:hypothetical protein MtrunA17_Chr6g0488151 [Medicago truncatula]|uniref:Uncharacterized protein n=1 Tax=Medicago truncatula TaxID=3880 RepID=A0A396HIH0_MEDTR|nr:hypothetical protein MtrunA17_Chr6g0488151 [Medicago truncatula]